MRRVLIVEQLEERIAPTVVNPYETEADVLTFTDSDGDVIRIAYFGPAGSSIDVTDDGGGGIGNNDEVGWITATGTDHTSAVIVTADGSGDGRFAVTHGFRNLTAGEDFGLVSLGVDANGETAGTVDLEPGVVFTVAGRLGGVVINGDINFDTGNHSITADGDIGLVEVLGNMTLDPTDFAYIAPGSTYGNSNVSFVTVGGAIYVSNGGSELAATHLAAGQTSLAIYDDVATGSSGYLKASVSGGAADIYAIPMKDGGYAVGRAELSDGASLSVTTYGQGAQVGEVTGAGTISGVSISGAAGSDLYKVEAAYIGSVTNNTVGGDVVSVQSDHTIGSITTKATGNLGTLLTGAGNYYPMLASSGAFTGSETFAGGTIGPISVGGVVDATVRSGDTIASIKALPGGIVDSSIISSGGIGPVQAGHISDSSLFAASYITSVKAGGAGIYNSTIESNGTIGLVSTMGAITMSTVDSYYETAGVAHGGAVTAVQAGSILGSDLSAYGGFGAIAVKGQIAGTTIGSKFTDLTGTVGGAIGTLTAFGISGNSTIEAISIASAAIGQGGISESSTLDAHTTISKVAVKGDVSDGSIINAGTGIGSLSLTGDLAYDARIGSGGYVTSLAIGGQVLGGDILITGNVGALAIKGGISGFGVTIGVGGNVGVFSVSGGISGQDFAEAGEDASTAYIEIDGAVGKFAVAGGVASANIALYDSATSVSIAGTMAKASLLVEGNLGTLAVRGDLNHVGLTVGADGAPVTAGSIAVTGGVTGCNDIDDDIYDIDIYGNVGVLSVKGSMLLNDIVVDGNVAAMTVGRGIYGTVLDVTGSTGAVTVGNAINTSNMIFRQGISSLAVKGSVYNASIGTNHYDADGNPMGGAIGTLTANDINGSAIQGYGGIGSVVAKGTIYNSYVEAVGRDNDGAGDIVGGAGINTVTAKGINGAQIAAYTSIGAMVLGDEGIAQGSVVAAVTGNLGSITTAGLIFGDIAVGGNVTGNILSAGADAVSLGGDINYHFRDANGVMTGGTLTVDGTIAGVVS
jgi:hypothetical protein